MRVKVAWETLCKLKVGAQAKKQKVLMDMVMPGKSEPHLWQTKLVQFKESVTHAEQKKIKKEKLTKGEFIQLHGFSEAMYMIKQGKVHEMRDEWGYPIYIRVKKSFTEQATRVISSTLTRTRINASCLNLMAACISRLSA